MESNVQKMREALESIYMDAQFICDNKYEPNVVRNRADRIERTVNSALSAPLRNCDIGTAEEQIDRFREFCETEKCGRYRCGSGCKAICIDRCAIAWSQMPYEKGDVK